MKHKKENEKISQTAINRAIFKRLPFLRNHFEVDDIGKVCFRNLDADLLLQSSKYYDEVEEDKDGDENEEADEIPCPGLINIILLFNKDGAKIGQVGVDEKLFTKGWWPCRYSIFEEFFFEETVEAALFRLKQKQPHYIVGKPGNGDENRLIISFPQGTLTIEEQLANEMEEAEKFVEAEIFKIKEQVPPVALGTVKTEN